MEEEKHKGILIVDDDESCRLTLGALLEDENYRVGYAKNGQDALRQIRETFWDLALVDYKLPEMSGIELVRELKAVSPKTVVYILTGYSAPQIFKESLEASVDGIFAKGDRPENILGMIRKAVAPP